MNTLKVVILGSALIFSGAAFARGGGGGGMGGGHGGEMRAPAPAVKVATRAPAVSRPSAPAPAMFRPAAPVTARPAMSASGRFRPSNGGYGYYGGSTYHGG